MGDIGNAHGAVIRLRRPDDLRDAAAALVAVHGTDGYPVEGVDDSTGWLTPPDLVQAWVAERDGRVVGHVAVSRPAEDEAVSLWLGGHPQDEGRVTTLARLFVLAEARKQALGERLVLAATDYARQHGLRLVLDVMTKDTAAIRLYERLGWRKFGTAVHAFGEGGKTDAACYVAPGGE